MNFKAKIYIKDKSLPFYKRWSISELLNWSSLFILLFSTCILILNEEYLDFKILETILKTICYISLFFFMISIFMRLTEYETLNGILEGEISFEKDSLIINNTVFNFAEIKDFNINFDDVYGNLTGNSKVGPMFSQGLKNSISFYHDSNFIQIFYQLKTENQVSALKQDLYFYIIQEILPLTSRTLQYVDKKFKHNNEFENLVYKYIKNGTFSCTEGLLMIGYSSDKEAVELRKKYCSNVTQ